MTPHDTGSTSTPCATTPPARTFGPQGPTLSELSDAYLQDYRVRQFRSQSTARGRLAHLTAFFGRDAHAATLTTCQIRQYQLARRAAGRASVSERVAMLLTGHKTRAIFDRYNIINEQELLEAGDQLVEYLAQQARTPRGRAAPARLPRRSAIGSSQISMSSCSVDGAPTSARDRSTTRSSLTTSPTKSSAS